MASGYPQHGRQPMQPCRDCNRPMMWVTMPGTGKRNGLDPTPSPDGDIILIQHGREASPWRLGVFVRDPDLREEARQLGIPLYTSHFATCTHRRPRRERKDVDG